jgi:hypothetical protein
MRLPSPSHRFVAEPSRSGDTIVLTVRDTDTGADTTLGERHAGWFSLSLGWDERERLWVRSGDTGVHVYERTGDEWAHRLWAADGPSEPDPSRVVHDLDSGRVLSVIGGDLPQLQEVPRA